MYLNFYERIRSLICLTKNDSSEWTFSLDENILWKDKTQMLNSIQRMSSETHGWRNSDFGWGTITISPEDNSVTYIPQNFGTIYFCSRTDGHCYIDVEYNQYLLGKKGMLPQNTHIRYKDMRDFLHDVDHYKRRSNNSQWVEVEDNAFLMKTEQNPIYLATNHLLTSFPQSLGMQKRFDYGTISEFWIWNNQEFSFKVLDYGTAKEHLTLQEYQFVKELRMKGQISEEEWNTFYQSIYYFNPQNRTECFTKILHVEKVIQEFLSICKKSLPDILHEVCSMYDVECISKDNRRSSLSFTFLTNKEHSEAAVASFSSQVISPDGSFWIRIPVDESRIPEDKRIHILTSIGNKILENYAKSENPALIAFSINHQNPIAKTKPKKSVF